MSGNNDGNGKCQSADNNRQTVANHRTTAGASRAVRFLKNFSLSSEMAVRSKRRVFKPEHATSRVVDVKR